jgi:hypothetical protein
MAVKPELLAAKEETLKELLRAEEPMRNDIV